MSSLFSGPPTVKIPPQVPLSNQLLESITAQATGLPIELAALQATQPGFTGLDLSGIQQQLFGQAGQPAGQPTTQTIQVPQYDKKGRLKGYTTQTIQIPGTPAQPAQPGTLALGTQAANQLRAADIAAVQQYGPQAMQAYLAANPYLAGSTQALFNNTVNSPLLPAMNQMALQQLQAGGRLTPEQQAFADQSALAKYQQMFGSASQPGAIGSELLNEDQYSAQRLANAFNLAQQTQSLGNTTLGGASQIFQSTLADPYQSVLGRGSGAGALGPVSGGAGGLSPMSSVANAQALLSPFAGQNFFQNQSQLQASQAIANANAAAAQQAGQLGLAGAGIGAAGSVIGGALAGG